MNDERARRIQSLIRNVPDFPKKGILFRDITTLLGDPDGFREVVAGLADPWRQSGVKKVVAIESRGFIFGAPVALDLGAGVVPVRKPGKLPARTLRHEYALEYGTDALEMHEDAIEPGERVLVVDDLLATGGTAAASFELIRRLGGVVVGAAFVIELGVLQGRHKLAPTPVHVLLTYGEAG